MERLPGMNDDAARRYISDCELAMRSHQTWTDDRGAEPQQAAAARTARRRPGTHRAASGNRHEGHAGTKPVEAFFVDYRARRQLCWSSRAFGGESIGRPLDLEEAWAAG
eukprot:7379260-Prymnesium_polylepis.2